MGVCCSGKNQDEFPWDNQNVKNGNGCFFANFKPDRGNYTKDGNLITSKVGIYGANSNGLFDMAGNVAEWTSTIYTEAGVDAMNDLNPQLDYKAAREDPYRLKKECARRKLEGSGELYPQCVAHMGVPEPAPQLHRLPLCPQSCQLVQRGCQGE